MNLTFRTDYWDDHSARQEFIGFLINIFNLDLTLWGKLGFWNNNFRPFSYFEGDKIVASLCIYSMDMMVDGKRRPVAQVSSVGTLPEYRLKGLNRQLTEMAIEWADKHHDFHFLFADVDAQPFYKKCGFRKVSEHKTCLDIEGKAPKPGVQKLDPGKKDHLDFIQGIASEREAVSNMLGVYNTRLFMFCCVYFLKDNIYYIKDLDTLILCERKGEILKVYDIVSKQVPAFADVYPYISEETDRRVEFAFMTDKMGLGDNAEIVLAEDGGTHLMGNFPLEGSEFLFPYTAHA